MFVPQKFAGLVSAMPSIDDISSRIPSIIASADKIDALSLAVQTSLWGNKIDLSLWPANNQATSSHQDNQAGKISSSSLLKDTLPYILDDQTSDVVSLLLKKSSKGDVGIVVDNAGYEVFSDLLLGHMMLALGVADTVTFHTKV
jgi:damage-control phosphatase, subfamily III